MSNKPMKHKDVCRIDQKETGTVGWYVRVRYQGKTHPKLFSDKLHGNKDAALNSAIEWRNETEQRIGKIRTDKTIVSVSKVSSTDVVGVKLNLKKNRYDVTWVSKNGKPGKTSVSIRKHGKDQAFKRACDIRSQKEAERLAAD